MNKENYNNLAIGYNKTLSQVRYPIFCKIIGNEYDTVNDVCFETAYKDLVKNDVVYAVLDSLDLSYQGYITTEDILEYECVNDLLY